jgi:polyhydroxyalkanoate synthesis repressor PhaR
MTPSEDPTTYRIRKYPNRRFYDATRSQHITLEGLFELVRDGHQIEVTDTEGNDITNVVLTQIMLDHDPGKLRLFSADLLHQAIQANQQMVSRFIDQYFTQAMSAFVQSREHFDRFLQNAGLSPLQASTPFDWAQTFMRSFTGQRPEAGIRGQGSGVRTQASEAQDQPPPAGELDQVRAEIERLRNELAQLKSKPKPSKAKTSRKKSAKPATKKSSKARKDR